MNIFKSRKLLFISYFLFAYFLVCFLVDILKLETLDFIKKPIIALSGTDYIGYLLVLGLISILLPIINLFRSENQIESSENNIQASVTKSIFRYQSKNSSNYVWVLPVIFLVFDFIIIGGNMDNAYYIIMPTLIGGGFGALIFWLNNKDLSVFIDDNKLIIKRNKSDIREYLSSEIVSYRVSKEQNKTILRITGNDKSEYQIASFALDLKGFENAMKEFLYTHIDNNILVEKNINENPKEVELQNLQSNSVSVDKPNPQINNIENKISGFIATFRSYSKGKKIAIIIGTIVFVFLVTHKNNNNDSELLKRINNSTSNSYQSSEKCSDMTSYNLGYSIAKDQQGLVADCDYLYDIAKTQHDNINRYCFCMGVSDFRLGK